MCLSNKFLPREGGKREREREEEEEEEEEKKQCSVMHRQN